MVFIEEIIKINLTVRMNSIAKISSRCKFFEMIENDGLVTVLRKIGKLSTMLAVISLKRETRLPKTGRGL